MRLLRPFGLRNDSFNSDISAKEDSSGVEYPVPELINCLVGNTSYFAK
jgi:hypothetical protein